MTQHFQWTDNTPVDEAVFQTLGFVSMCWENPKPEGEFDSVTAKEAGEELVEFLHRKQIGI